MGGIAARLLTLPSGLPKRNRFSSGPGIDISPTNSTLNHRDGIPFVTRTQMPVPFGHSETRVPKQFLDREYGGSFERKPTGKSMA
jgi:hypothetical protein